MKNHIDAIHTSLTAFVKTLSIRGIRRVSFLIVIFVFVLLTSLVLAEPKKPTLAQMKVAIPAKIDGKGLDLFSSSPSALNLIPIKAPMARPWVGVKVEFVSLIRFGEYNSSSAYWPVETCVRLRCSDTLQMPGVPVADQIVYLKMRFAFSGNDFGEWEATELPPTAGTKSEDLVCTPSTSNDAEDSEVTSGGSNLTLSGYVIDVRCGSQKHIFNDASHHNCAVACVKGHGVIGLYVNNTIYELRDSKGNSLSQELLSYLGKVITVKGNVLNASPTPIFEDAGHTAPIDLQGVKVLSISSWNAQ